MKIHKQIPLTIFALIITLPLFAQIGFNEEGKTSYIEVTGTAEKEIVPDEIYITINLAERMNGKEKISIEQQATDLYAELEKIGIPIEDFMMADALASYTRIRWSKKDVMANAEYLLKVGDAVTVGRVFKILDDMNIEDASIDRVSHSEIQAFRKEVKIMAIRAAKDKANYLLEAIGEQTDKPIIVFEREIPSYNSNDHSNVRGARTSATNYYIDGEPVQDIQFEHITLKAAVYVKFAIQ